MKKRKKTKSVPIPLPEKPSVIEGVKQEINDYKQFAFGRNIFAVAGLLVLTNSVQKVVNVICDNLIMPTINFFITQADGDWKATSFRVCEGLNWKMGEIGSVFLEFFITTLLIYLIFKKMFKIIDDPKKPKEGNR